MVALSKRGGLLVIGAIFCACNAGESSSQSEGASVEATRAALTAQAATPNGCRNTEGQAVPRSVPPLAAPAGALRADGVAKDKVRLRQLTAADVAAFGQSAAVDRALLARQQKYQAQWESLRPSLANLSPAEQQSRREALKASIVEP